MTNDVKRHFLLPWTLTGIFVALSFIPIIQIIILTFSGGLISSINKVLGKDTSGNIIIANLVVNLLPTILFLILFYRSKTPAARNITAIFSMIFMTAFIFFMTDGIYKDSDPYFLNFLIVAIISGFVLTLVSILKYRQNKQR